MWQRRQQFQETSSGHRLTNDEQLLFFIHARFAVSRIEAKSETYDTELTLDVNTEIYPIMQSETIEILLSEQLDDAATKPDSADDMQGYNPTKPLGDRADDFEYIMRGKIFKYTEKHMRAYVWNAFLFVLFHCDQPGFSLLCF